MSSNVTKVTTIGVSSVCGVLFYYNYRLNPNIQAKNSDKYSVSDLQKEAKNINRKKVRSHKLCPFRRGLEDTDYDAKGKEWKWRTKRPDYTKANHFYLTGKLNNWKGGSLEEVVSNLVKTMEMELTHKPDPTQWVSMDTSVFKYSTNGNKFYTPEDTVKVGTYNILLSNAKNNKNNELYDTNCQWLESHQQFHAAFPTTGFVWEVLKVYSGPPDVAFKWHHWGLFDGIYNGKKGNGKVIHLYGYAIANVKLDKNKNVILNNVKIFYDVEKFLAEINQLSLEDDMEPQEEYEGLKCNI